MLYYYKKLEGDALKIEYGRSYDYEIVKEEVRRRQLCILDSVVAICDKHGLAYWLDGGTLLGAVRHQGFIPWDDDIDIGMMREDYERFLSIADYELPESMILQSRDTDTTYKLPFAKVRDLFSDMGDEYRFNGIFIDIFPFDVVPRSILLKRLQRRLYRLLEAMMILTDIRKLRIANKKGLKAKVKRGLMYILSAVGGLLGKGAFNPLYGSILKLSYLNPSNDVGDGLAGSWAYYKSIRHKNVYLPTKTAYFETKEYKVPHNTDVYLSTLYGKNYMTPIKQDRPHIEKVVFLKNKKTKK